MNKKQMIYSIETELLDIANLYNECTTSDLQGVAMAKAHTIYSMFEICFPDYKKAYHILMKYFDSISDEEKPKVDKALKEECGL